MFTVTGPSVRRQRPCRAGARLLACLLLGAAAVALLPRPAAAGSNILANYDLSLAGVPLASFAVQAELRDSAYLISGEMKASRLVKVVARISGWSRSSGSIGQGRIAPEEFQMLIKWGDDRRTVRLGFDGETVERVAIVPPRDSPANRVPLTRKHRVGVIDPFSAVLMPVPAGELSGETACERTLPIFDGQYRYDLALSYKRTVPARENGGASDLYVCKVTYVPIAGHKPKREQTAFWRDRDDIELWLAAEPRTNMMMPHRAVLPTPLGDAILSLRGLDIRPLRQAAELGGRP